jgi:HAD superfamily hydrolase (TIGR01509 family)
MQLIKGIIFDLDGVLVDTEGYQWQGWVEILKPLGISLSKEEYFKYAGKTGNIIESELVKDYNLKIEKGSLLKQKEELLIEWFSSKELKLLPYAKEAIEFFIDKKMKIAIASGGPKDEIILKLKRIDLYSLFPVITSSGEVKRGKPFPDIYLLSAERLELKPEECLAFEDTQYGLGAAKSAGLTCFAVPGEFSVKQDFSRADKTFTNLKEAIEFYKKEANN